jgi:hypothetical protein
MVHCFFTEYINDCVMQNSFYSGYECDTTINNVFAYGLGVKVFFCALNFPGRRADGSLTARFQPHFLKRVCAYKICVDQGFSRSGTAWNVLVGPVNDCTAQGLHP